MCHAMQTHIPIDSNAPEMFCPLVMTPKKPALSKITRKEMIEDLKYLDPYAYEGDEYDTMDDEILIDLYNEVIMEVEAADEGEAKETALDKLLQSETEKIKAKPFKPTKIGKPIPESVEQIKGKKSILTCKSRFDDIV
jgi:hypothetical protein